MNFSRIKLKKILQSHFIFLNKLFGLARNSSHHQAQILIHIRLPLWNMGIQGLLPVLSSITTDVHVGEYAGQRVAVDAYCWLHKAAYSCSAELCQNIPTTKYVNKHPSSPLPKHRFTSQ